MSRTRLIFPALLLVAAACSSPEPATDQIEETPAPEVPAPAPAPPPVVTDTMPPADTGAVPPAAPATTPPTGG